MASVLSWISGSGVVQGTIIGATCEFLTAIVVMNAVGRTITTSINGWRSIRRCGRPGNGFLVRAACAKALPAVNLWEEAAYWTAREDGSGAKLRGAHDYVLRFPSGQLPPNEAFWSLTTTDVVGYVAGNPRGPSSVDDRSNLVANSDGSIDIYLQHEAPAGHEQNWLATPSSRFRLILRAYLPGQAILDGTYRVPPVVRAR
jgi:hypothetical protein